MVLIFAIRPWMRTCKVRNVSWRERVLTKFEAYVVKGTHRAQANMGQQVNFASVVLQNCYGCPAGIYVEGIYNPVGPAIRFR